MLLMLLCAQRTHACFLFFFLFSSLFFFRFRLIYMSARTVSFILWRQWVFLFWCVSLITLLYLSHSLSLSLSLSLPLFPPSRSLIYSYLVLVIPLKNQSSKNLSFSNTHTHTHAHQITPPVSPSTSWASPPSSWDLSSSSSAP